jgi:hypothetical protein
MEVWTTNGGNEVYNNEFYGGECAIDLSSIDASETAGHWKTVYDYSWYIHDNLFDNGQKQAAPEADNDRFHITIEDCNVNDVWITRNHFLQTPCPISIEIGTNDIGPYNRIYVYYNIFEDIGYTNNAWAGCLYIKSYGANAVYNDIRFQQNVVMGGPVGKPVAGILFYLSGTVNGLNITNNIILNSYTAWLHTSSNATKGTINNLVVRNNILYGNANANAVSDATNMIAAGTYVNSGNIIDDPGFISSTNFHLSGTSPASPCIDAGYDLNLVYDYDGIGVDPDTPCIGAYEYIGTSPPVVPIPVTSVTVNGAGGATTISVNGGTLQMSATVLPIDADDLTVTWSVTNGTGSATISATGLLTALTDGTVTVKATSNG